MSDLIDTTEMYLRTILELEEEGIVPMRARIVERFGHSGPTVSQTIARMERDGLVKVGGDRRLELTDAGRQRAVAVMRKHRLAERLLLDVIGLEWEYVHDEACRWEHVISDRVERKLLQLIPDALESPYGNPIPGLALLEGAEERPAPTPAGLRSLIDALDPPGDGTALVVRRLGEPLQTRPDLLAAFARVGLRPGTACSASRHADVIRLTVSGEDIDLDVSAAAHVFVVSAS